MTDYGHELEFGLFPSPDAAAAHHVLELAAVAEVSGLDLVTVQDHPYQARHLDAWTLLSVIAARTSTLRVALNVANLPLRNPVVLAGSVASLDLLSGGRVELGIGAGAFWDAIEAAGGRAAHPGRGGRGARGGHRRHPWRCGRARAACGSTVRTTGPSGCTRARRRRTRWGSGSVPTSRGCCGSPAGSPTAGCRARATRHPTPSAR